MRRDQMASFTPVHRPLAEGPFFHDANNNDQLDVDGQGQPLEHWNYTERTWEADDAETARAL